MKTQLFLTIKKVTFVTAWTFVIRNFDKIFLGLNFFLDELPKIGNDRYFGNTLNITNCLLNIN